VGHPDVVVREITDFGALVAAEVLGLPHVIVGAGLFIEAGWWRYLLRGRLERIRPTYRLPADVPVAGRRPVHGCLPVPLRVGAGYCAVGRWQVRQEPASRATTSLNPSDLPSKTVT
jgi:hypothetical protein